MPKNGKTTSKENLLHIIARSVAEIKDNMITNMATKVDLEGVERRLSAKIDAVEEKVDDLEMVDVLNLQGRVSVLEKDVKQLKHRNV